MLKMLYIHDHVFKNNGQKYYSEGKITDEVFDRYVNHKEDQIYVLSRMEKCQDTENLTEIQNRQVLFQPVFGLKMSQIYILYFFNNINLICSLLKKVDFIIIRMPSFLGVLVFLLNLFFKKKFFIEFVGDPEESLNNVIKAKNIFTKFFINFFVFTNKKALLRASGVIYVTKKFLQQKYPTMSYQEYASNVEINVDLMNLSIDDYKLNSENCKIGLIGSFNNSYKGIDVAIDAVADLKKKGIIVELHILGSGTLQKRYEEYSEILGISNQIIFDGKLSSRNEINQWCDHLDIYVQPSRTEGLPRALVEAMSRGLPAVATNVGGIPELLDADFIVESNDAIALSNKLHDLILSQQLRFEQGILNYETAKEYDSKILKERRKKFWNYARNLVYR